MGRGGKKSSPSVRQEILNPTQRTRRGGSFVFCTGSGLWNVVTERGPAHGVDAPGAAARVGGATRARPEIALEAGILEAEAHSALRTVVEVVPVPHRELLHILVLVAAAD